MQNLHFAFPFQPVPHNFHSFYLCAFVDFLYTMLEKKDFPVVGVNSSWAGDLGL